MTTASQPSRWGDRAWDFGVALTWWVLGFMLVAGGTLLVGRLLFVLGFDGVEPVD
ncbi:MAG: hypothetical protein ABI586_01175 [Candidatus Nanopelagicales bacterium]